MAKFINILAASIGGGVVLGAGIRMVEAMAAERRELPDSAGPLLGRLDLLEERLARMEAGSLSGKPFASRAGGDPVGAGTLDNEDAADVAAAMDHAFSSVRNRLNSQQADIDGMRAQLASADLGIVHLNQQGEQLREELRGWVDENVRQRIGAAEAKLQRNIERTQQHTLDALVEGVQTRVILRISKLEDEVAGQSAAMAELRECSLSTERSMQKLLEGIDKLVSTQARAEAKPEEPRASDSAMAPSAGEGDAVVRPEPVFGSGAAGEKPPLRRWGLFR
jgi:hypothetical protein